MNIIKIDSTTSTNLYLKELIQEKKLEEKTLVITETQTAGRGQAGSSWESESGKNITCSLVLYPTFLSVKQNFLLSEIIALSIKQTLDEYLDSVQIKWPNDIYFKDKKIAGVLIENEIQGKYLTQSIVGIGLNVNQETFSSNIPNPVSLKQILGLKIDKDNLLQILLDKIDYWYNQLKSGDVKEITQTYHDALYRRSGFYSYRDKNGNLEAEIISVQPDGQLLLRTSNGEERAYYFKEVVYNR